MNMMKFNKIFFFFQFFDRWKSIEQQQFPGDKWATVES